MAKKATAKSNKQCPVCKMEVDSEAETCPGCAAEFDDSPQGATALHEIEPGPDPDGDEEDKPE